MKKANQHTTSNYRVTSPSTCRTINPKDTDKQEIHVNSHLSKTHQRTQVSLANLINIFEEGVIQLLKLQDHFYRIIHWIQHFISLHYQFFYYQYYHYVGSWHPIQLHLMAISEYNVCHIALEINKTTTSQFNIRHIAQKINKVAIPAFNVGHTTTNNLFISNNSVLLNFVTRTLLARYQLIKLHNLLKSTL